MILSTGDHLFLPPVEDMNENQLKLYKKGKYATLQEEYGDKPDTDATFNNKVFGLLVLMHHLVQVKK